MTRKRFEFVRKIDLFKTDLPSFNFNGQTDNASVMGGIATILMLYITLNYAGMKLGHLMVRHNPLINSVLKTDEVPNDERYDFIDNNFMMAFGLEDTVTKKSLDDPKFIKWLAYYVEFVDGERIRTELPVYKCTDEDFARFYPIEPSSATRLANAKSGKT